MDTVQRLRELLNERNISMVEITKLSGVSYSTITSAEKRGGQLTVDTIFRLCYGLKISLSEFFSGAGPYEHGTLIVQMYVPHKC